MNPFLFENGERNPEFSIKSLTRRKSKHRDSNNFFGHVPSAEICENRFMFVEDATSSLRIASEFRSLRFLPKN